MKFLLLLGLAGILALPAGAQLAPTSRRLLAQGPVPAAAASSYDFLIPNLITAFANTSNSTFYSTASFSATNGALLLAMVNVSYASAPTANGSCDWNGHTWFKLADTNYNVKSSAFQNLSVWRTLATNTSSATFTATNFAATPTGCGIAVFQVLNADDSAPLGSNAIVRVTTGAVDAAVNPSLNYTQPANAGTNMLVLFMGDNVNASTGRTPNSSNQWQVISQTSYATPNSGSSVFFSPAALAGRAAVTNYGTLRDAGFILVEVQPKAYSSGTNYADALVGPTGTNVVGTVLTRFAITNATRGKFEQYDFFFSQNVGNSETATNWFFKAQTNPLKIPVRVGNYGSSNQIFLTTTPTFGLGLRASNNFTYAVHGRASPANNLILKTEGFVYLGMTNGSLQVLYDLVRSDGNVSGDFVVFQLDAGIFASGRSNRLNIESNPSGVTTHSTMIAVQTNATVYWMLQDNRLTGICRLTVWDVRSGVWTLIGDVTSTQSHIGTGTADTDISPLKFGNAESGTSSGEIIFENIEVDDSSGRYSTNWVSGLGP